MIKGAREHLKRVLLWLPRTKENFSYVVRSLRNYLNRMDPDCFSAVVEECRPVLEEAWSDIHSETALAVARPYWVGQQQERHMNYAENSTGFWDIQRHVPGLVEHRDKVVAVLEPVTRRLSWSGFLWAAGVIASTSLVWRTRAYWVPLTHLAYTALCRGSTHVRRYAHSVVVPTSGQGRILVGPSGTITIAGGGAFSAFYP